MTIEQARALVERQARAWECADVAAITADFAPDGVLISPGGRWQGHDALRTAANSRDHCGDVEPKPLLIDKGPARFELLAVFDQYSSA